MFSSRKLSVIKRPIAVLMALLMLVFCVGCVSTNVGNTVTGTDETTHISNVTDEVSSTADQQQTPDTSPELIAENGSYYSRDDVALYIYTYGHLPNNFITKDEAAALGWEGGSVERYLEGAAIGGDKFGNREGLLPKANGRIYYECDIDTNGQSSRGSKRIVFSNDGLIFYTDDHYESFTKLYGEE